MYPINSPIRLPAEFEQNRGFRKSLAIPRYKCFTCNFCFLNTAETDTPQTQSRSGESLSGTHHLSTKPRGRSLSGGAGGHTISQQERRGRRGHTTSQQGRRQRRGHTISQQERRERQGHTTSQQGGGSGGDTPLLNRGGGSGGDTPLLNTDNRRAHAYTIQTFKPAPSQAPRTRRPCSGKGTRHRGTISKTGGHTFSEQTNTAGTHHCSPELCGQPPLTSPEIQPRQTKPGQELP